MSTLATAPIEVRAKPSLMDQYRLVRDHMGSVSSRWIGWVLFLAAIYLEAAALLVAFRPAIHRWWGIGLIMLHLGIGLANLINILNPEMIEALELATHFQCRFLHRPAPASCSNCLGIKRVAGNNTPLLCVASDKCRFDQMQAKRVRAAARLSSNTYTA